MSAIALAAWPSIVAAQPATAALTPAPPALATRVTAFFSAWKDRDLAAMYEFYCPPYREKTPRTEYLKLSRILRFPILEFAVRGVEVEGGKTTVVIHLKNDTAPIPRASSRPTPDRSGCRTAVPGAARAKCCCSRSPASDSLTPAGGVQALITKPCPVGRCTTGSGRPAKNSSMATRAPGQLVKP